MGGGSFSNVEGIKRIGVDVRESTFETLEQLAEYRNALAKVTNKTLRRKQTVKSTAESELEAAIDSLMDDLAPMFEVVGPWPEISGDEAADAEAFQAYAARVVASAGKIEAAAKRRENLDAGK